jgi:predicted small lipoprotein YifL
MRPGIVVSALLLLCGAVLLAGCGQKGPLFLPTKSAVPASAASAQPVPAMSTARPAPASTAAVPAADSSSSH